MPTTEKIVAGLSLILASTAMVFLAALFYLNPKLDKRENQTTSLSTLHIAMATGAKSKLDLPEVFDNRAGRYLIKYPVNWQYDNSKHGIVVMNGIEGSSANSSINIQAIHTQKSGGQFTNVGQFISALEKQTPRAQVIERGPITLTGSNGKTLEGEYLISTFKNEGTSYKQWQIIVMRQDAPVFYTWEFLAPKDQFARDLPVAQAVLSSWQIY